MPLGHAQTPPSTPQAAADLTAWSSSDLYQYGTDLLKRGRLYERAIHSLELAVSRTPDDPDYHLALGCAYASRFAAMGFARDSAKRLTYEHRKYDERLKQWEEDQADRSRPLYGTPPPVPPPSPVTPDDDRPFEMTEGDSMALMTHLGRRCVAELDRAHDLAEVAVKKEPSNKALRARRAETEYTCGWAQLMLWRYGFGVVNVRTTDPAAPPSRAPETAGDSALTINLAKVAAAFQQAADDAPDNLDYRRSLAVALVPSFIDPARDGIFMQYDDWTAVHKKETVTRALAILDRVLAVKSRDDDSLYQAALTAGPADSSAAVRYLETLTGRRGADAVLWYILAEQRFRAAAKETGPTARSLQDAAIGAIRTGNAAPQYRALPLRLPTPRVLQKACELRHAYGFADDVFLLEQNADSVKDYVTARLKASETSAAVEAVTALMDMALKAIANAGSVDPTTLDARTRRLPKVRVIIAVIEGYRACDLMRQIYEAQPDAQEAILLRRYDDLREQYLRPLDMEMTKSP